MGCQLGQAILEKQCSKIFMAIRTIESVGNISGLAFCQVYEAGSGRAIEVTQAPEGGNTQCYLSERKS